MALPMLRVSAPLCHCNMCGNILFTCLLLHQIISASGAESGSVVLSVLSPGAVMVPVSEKGKCLFRERLLCTTAFSPWEEGCSRQGRVSVPTTAGGMSGSTPPLGLRTACLPSSRSLLKRPLLQASFPDALTWLFSTSPSPGHSLLSHLRSPTSEIIFFNSHGHCLSSHHCVGPARAGA